MEGFEAQGAAGVPEPHGPPGAVAGPAWPVALPGDGTVQPLNHSPAQTWALPPTHGCTARSTASRLREVILSLHSAFVRPYLSAVSGSGAPSIRRMWTCRSRS